jgi:hypothetical protein
MLFILFLSCWNPGASPLSLFSILAYEDKIPTYLDPEWVCKDYPVSSIAFGIPRPVISCIMTPVLLGIFPLLASLFYFLLLSTVPSFNGFCYNALEVPAKAIPSIGFYVFIIFQII